MFGEADESGVGSILQKHIKRQIISLNGGFQVIADLNAYNVFITSLRVRLSDLRLLLCFLGVAWLTDC